MPDFAYRAAQADGRIFEGHVDAANREAAMRTLRGKGLTPLQLDVTERRGADLHAASAAGKDGAGPAAGEAAFPARRRMRLFSADRGPDHADVHSITGQLSVMLRAGLPLDRALRVLIGMGGKPSVTALLEDVFKSVKAGKGLSQALAPHQALFGEFYINMVRSGEAGGQLADVLGRLAEHLERVKELRESVVSALIYPAILVVVAAISVFLMLGFVVPQFETLFDDMGEALPLPTRLIVAAGHLVADWGWLIVLVVAGLVWLVRRWLATPAGRDKRDAWMLRLPVLGEVTRKYEVTRFARSMGTLLGNGVPIVTALKIAAETMTNQRLRAAMAGVAPAIKQGGRMADALGKTQLFTPLGLNMIRLGEETGRLDAMLQELARVHDVEVQAGVKRALTLLEPLLILTLGAVIAAIIVSILMGILSVNDLAM
ncbi:type II secretion system F family protein [Aromatoleum buckelii]|uniref:Type II secretion system F family protein n=1 Tax=Aromatoleum buckelii TaxID=200254 RepID=A0ABX1N4C7_9RHOO|nr:type II secretion system F family protein [Aromatoleum buckelii]MCK0511877.1 type II secretion system F family protein [Aromatoleum buckelii]